MGHLPNYVGDVLSLVDSICALAITNVVDIEIAICVNNLTFQRFYFVFNVVPIGRHKGTFLDFCLSI